MWLNNYYFRHLYRRNCIYGYFDVNQYYICFRIADTGICSGWRSCSISNVNQKKYEALFQSLSQAFGNSGKSVNESVIPKGSGILDGGTGLTSKDIKESGDSDKAQSDQGNDIDTSDGISKEEFARLREKLYKTLKDSKLKDKLRITVEDKGMVISLPNDILFDSGEADVKPEMKPILDQVAVVLNSVNTPILVEGYTDNVPVNNNQYRSNWQLSAERAANMVQYLIENYKMKPERLAAIGYGEYKPVASNKMKEGRMKNRRISITLLYNEDVRQIQK